MSGLTNPHATRLLLVGGAAFYVLSQWEETRHYLAYQMTRRKVRRALTALAVLLYVRRKAAYKRMQLNTDPETTFDFANNPWTGEPWFYGEWMDQMI